MPPETNNETPQTTRELAERLIQVIDARDEAEKTRRIAADKAEDAAKRVDDLNDEIAALERTIASRAKGRKGSRPTRAASSSNWSHGEVAGMVRDLMSDGKARTAAKVCSLLGIEDRQGKQQAANALRRMFDRGKAKRRDTGEKTNAKKSVYEYQLIG